MANINNTPDPNLIPLIMDKNDLLYRDYLEKFNVLLDTTVHSVFLDITTNEIVYQRDKGDIRISNEIGGLSNVNTIGATAGMALVYNGSNWVASNILETSLSYVRNTPSTRLGFSDILSVSSIIDSLDKILYPYLPPSYNLFSIPAKQTTLELGEYLSTSSGGVEIFNWSVSTISNVSLTYGFTILDITNSYTLATGLLPNTLTSSSINIPYSIRKTTTNQTHVFRIQTKNTQNNLFSKDMIITWKPKIFWGTSPLSTALNSAQIIALPSSPTGGSKLTDSIQNSFTMNGNGEYIWFVMPSTFGYAINPDGSSSRILVGGLANSFWDVFTVSFTNAQGYTQNYYAYKSKTVSFGTNVKIQIV